MSTDAEPNANDEEEEEDDNLQDEKGEYEEGDAKVPTDWGNCLHHQYGAVSTQVETGLHALKRVVQHIEKVSQLHANLAKARKTASEVKSIDTPTSDMQKDFSTAYVTAQNLNLHATECLYAFSLAVTEQIIAPGRKFYKERITVKRELDKQMKRRDELHQKLSAGVLKDVKICEKELSLLVAASDEKKQYDGKKFSDLSVEQQKQFNKLDGNKTKAQGKTIKLLKDYYANFQKARQAQEERMAYVRYALNTLRNMERERMELSAVYMYKMEELYSNLLVDLQKLSLTEKLGAMSPTTALEDWVKVWQGNFGPPTEDVLLEYGLPCSPEEAEKDIFKSVFPDEVNKAKYAKEELKDPANELVTETGRLLESCAIALATRANKKTEGFDPARDELSLRQREEVNAMLRKAGKNIPFLEQVELSTGIVQISEQGTRQKRIFLLTDKAIYTLSTDKLALLRRVGYETISAVTSSNKSSEIRMYLKGKSDFHFACQKQQNVLDVLKIFITQYFSSSPELDARLKRHQMFFTSDSPSLLKLKQGQKKPIGLGVDLTDAEEASLQFAEGGTGQGNVHAKDFTAVGLLGQGTFGRVLLVTKKNDYKTYAMKILNKKFLVSNDQVKNIKNEQQIFTQVDHPFIVKAHFTFTGHDHIYMVLDYVSGGELYNHLRKLGKFPEDSAKYIVAEVSLALGHLHSKNIIYRDLKPENVLLDDKGHVKITDFGTAKSIEPTKRTYSFCGTPQYLAPEIVLNYGHDRMVDWWGLGILLYELTIGVAPFSDDNPKALHEKIQNGVLKFPSSMSAPCKDLIVALLNRSAKHRLGSNNDVEDIKKHEFFAGLDWEKLAKRELTPPFIPSPVQPAKMTKAQQKEFKDEQSNSVLTLVPGFRDHAKQKQSEIDANFRNFSWSAASMEEYAANSSKIPRRPGDTETTLSELEVKAGMKPEPSKEDSKREPVKNGPKGAPTAPPPPPVISAQSIPTTPAPAPVAASPPASAAPMSVSQTAAALAARIEAPPPPTQSTSASSAATIIAAAKEKAAAEKAAKDAADKVLAEKALEEKAVADKAASEKVALEKAAAIERAAAAKALADKLAAEILVAEKLAAEKLAADNEKAALEKAAAERLLADKKEAERIATERIAAEKAAEKAELEKAAKAAMEKAAKDKQLADKLQAETIAKEKEQEAAEAKAAADELAAAEAEILAAEQAFALATQRAAEKQKPAEVVWEVLHKGGLRVRSSPNKDAPEVGVVAMGTKIIVLGQDGDWIHHPMGWTMSKTPNGKSLIGPT